MTNKTENEICECENGHKYKRLLKFWGGDTNQFNQYCFVCYKKFTPKQEENNKEPAEISPDNTPQTKPKRLKIQMNGRSDEFGTPKEAIYPLLPYLKRSWKIYECAWGNGHLAKHLEEEGFIVIGDKNVNFLKRHEKRWDASLGLGQDFDCIVTNPPYSKKYEFLEVAFKEQKPFAFLMPLTTLEGKKRGELFSKYGIQLIIPNKRINFITPSGKGSGAWFQVAWFCWKLDLPKEINFVRLG